MEKRGKAWMGLVLAALVGLGGCGQGPARTVDLLPLGR